MDADYLELRTKMVDGQLRTTDVTDADILAAMGSVPREQFVAARKRDLAYIDEDLEIAPAREGAGRRFLMEPSPFAKLVQLAEIGPGDFVLDVGCGTGYSSAVISRLAGSVIALESDAVLADWATETLASLECDNVVVVQGPLRDGYAAEAPYDAIILGGAVGEVPANLLDQLKEGGRLVAVEGAGNSGVAKIFLRNNGIVTGRRAFNAAVKPLSGFERVPAFEF